MAIDSVRLLADSAAQIWRRLDSETPLEALVASDCFEDWLSAARRANLDQAEEQSLRRDYRRLINLIEEIETLVRSRTRALDLVRSHLAETQIA